MHRLSFTLFLLLTWPMRWLPYSAIHKLGTMLGTLVYYCVPKFRKRSLSNLALASNLNLSEQEIIQLAKESLQNLIITCLEYAKFAAETDIHHVAQCINPIDTEKLMQENKPVIFFGGHLSNWEVPFLELTSRMSGVAIGRPVKNKYLYNWLVSIREKFNGKMIAPRNAIREGLRALKDGSFLGIVGDQGMPDSGYSSLFLGRMAWTSPAPALISQRTGAPIIVASTLRAAGKYTIELSDPIWPDLNAPKEQEIDRLMRTMLSLLEQKISAAPGQWLWSHNRWKQQTPAKLKRRFRYESILIILPENPEPLLPALATMREIYPHEFITVYTPKNICMDAAEIILYSNENDLLKRDYRFKLVFNFTDSTKVKSHFKKLAAFEVVSLEEIYSLANVKRETSLSIVLKKALLKAKYD